MQLFENTCRPVKTTQQFLPLRFLFPSPTPPKKKTSTSYPKTSCYKQRPVTKDSRPKPTSDRVLPPSSGHISSPLATAWEQRPYRAPNRNMTYVIRGSRSCPHQESHPSKQVGTNTPPPNAIRSRAHAMDQGYLACVS